MSISAQKSHVYTWMIIPFLAMQVGIFMDYWPVFTHKNWGVHIHYWSGTLWYAFLIFQPWLIAKNNIETHRLWGMIGFFIAGGVAFSAFTLYEHDIRSAFNAELEGSDEAYYFTAGIMMQNVLLLGFIYMIIKSMIHRKNIEEHAWWLIMSGFCVMLPAISRGVFRLLAFLYGGYENFSPLLGIILTSSIIGTLALVTAWRFNKWKHPATWIAATITAFAFLVWEVSARSEFLHEFFKRSIVIDT